MQHAERLTLAEMQEFLAASNTLSFAAAGRKQIYGLVEGVLRPQQYLGLSKKDKGIVRRYLVKISGLSKAQITRLIARWRERGVIQPQASRCHRFPRRYTARHRERHQTDPPEIRECRRPADGHRCHSRADSHRGTAGQAARGVSAASAGDQRPGARPGDPRRAGRVPRGSPGGRSSTSRIGRFWGFRGRYEITWTTSRGFLIMEA